MFSLFCLCFLNFLESGNRTPVTRNRLIKQNNKYSTVISNKHSLAEPKEEFGIQIVKKGCGQFIASDFEAYALQLNYLITSRQEQTWRVFGAI